MNKVLLFFLLLFSFILEISLWTNLYLDNSNFPLNFNDYVITVEKIFSAIWSWSYFWYDNTSLHTTRWLGILIQWVWMFPLFIIYFICNFYFSKELLKIYFPEKSAILWALFFSFNPVSIYYLSVSWFLFNYTSILLILYGVYKLYYKPYKIKYLCLFLIWFIFFLSYTRSIGLYGIIFFSLIITYRNFILNFIKKYTILFYSFSLLTAIVIAPFLFSVFYPIISWENTYFSWLWNYADVWRNWWEWLYNKSQDTNFIFHMLPSEILSNFAQDFQNNIFFKWISFILILTTIFISFISKEKNKNIENIFITFQIFLLTSIFIIWSASFLPSKIFITLYYDFFPFLANNLKWIYLIYTFVITFFISFSHMTLKKKGKKMYQVLIYVYILIILSPILFFNNNSKVQLISSKIVPEDYSYFSENKNLQGAIFSPYDYRVLYDWAPYPLNLNFARSKYKTPFQNNSRTVTNKQLNLYNIIWNSIHNPIENLKIFNIKNFFVFNNVINTDIKYDYFKEKNYLLESEQQRDFLRMHENINLVTSNSNFSHYSFKDSDDFDFFLYSPAKIQEIKWVDDFYKTPIDINQKLLLIDNKSFNAPINANLNTLNENIKIDYKKITNDSTKYFLKISNIDAQKNFIIHLNQTFGTSWKLKWINQKEYERHICNSQIKYHEKTNNTLCEINNYTIFNSLKDYKYRDYHELKNQNHFEGNMVWNSWIIESSDIVNQIENDGDLYAIIIYEKQFWHIFFMILSILVIWILIFISFFQEIINYITKYKIKKRKL